MKIAPGCEPPMSHEPPFRPVSTMTSETRAALRREGVREAAVQVRRYLRVQVRWHMHRARAALAPPRPPPATRPSGGWLRRGE